MTCEKILPRVGAYIDGEIPEVEREEVERHLLSCQACTRQAEDFQWFDQLAALQSIPAVSGDEWGMALEAVFEKAAAGGQTLEKRGRTTGGFGAFRKKLVAPALALAALLLIGLSLHFMTTGFLKPASSPSPTVFSPSTNDKNRKNEVPEETGDVEETTGDVEETTGSFADRDVLFLRGRKPEIRQGYVYYGDF